MIQFPIAGSATLDEIRLTCGTTENVEICKLVHLRKLPVVNDRRRNMASFAEVEIEDEVPDLVLVAVPKGGNAASLIADQLAKGRQLIFDETIFVENKDTEVLGFR
ncbi:MAG TPA: hypothetical protein VF591_11580 [Pyrinomonadaceae bacterium]|jgi:hypothetical protein